MRLCIVIILLASLVSLRGADGFLRVSGGTSGIAALGAGTNSVKEYILSNSVAVGATTIYLDRTPGFPVSGVLVIDGDVVTGEARVVSATAGHSVTVAALRRAHSAGVRVFWEWGDIPASRFGAKGGNASIDDGPALLNGWHECGLVDTYWNGGGQIYYTALPTLAPAEALMRHAWIRRHADYTPYDTNNALFMGPIQGVRVNFTGEADDDTITTATDWNNPGNTRVVFYGASLPAPLVQGRVYYTTNGASTTLQVSETQGGAVLALSGDGSGEMYPEVFSMQRINMQDMTFDGFNSPSNMVGVWLVIQQPSLIQGLRVRNVTNGFGLFVDPLCQDGEFYDTFLNHCQTNYLGGLSMVYMGINGEFFDRLDLSGQDNKYENIHLENHMPTTGPIIYVTNLIGGTLKNVIFASGTAAVGKFPLDINGSSLTYENIDVGFQDAAQIAVRDVVRKQTNYSAETSTQPMSAGRGQALGVLGRIPSSQTFYDRFSSFTAWGPDGSWWTMGAHSDASPFSSSRLRYTTSPTNHFQLEAPDASVRLAFKSDGGLAVTNITVGLTNNAPTITSGDAVPSSAQPNGSLYLRTDGSYYLRTNATWVVK